MLQQIEGNTISFSPSAAKAVNDILTEKKLEGYALRIYVSEGGCCGVQFGMALDNNITDNDTTIETDGIKLVIDQASIEYLQGATIDFINDPQRGAGFIVNAPNVGKQGNGEGCGNCNSSCNCGD